MRAMSRFSIRLRICAAVTVCAGGILLSEASDEPIGDSKNVSIAPSDVQNPDPQINESHRVSIVVARDRAKLMHDIYSATLDVMHDRYFHADRAIVPARAMEDVFSEIEQRTGSTANWIAVNMRAMSINHEATTDFEKRAAREIGAGKTDIEVIEEGFYRRAGAIPMTGGCISCHGGFANKPSKNPKFSALVISIPIVVASADK